MKRILYETGKNLHTVSTNDDADTNPVQKPRYETSNTSSYRITDRKVVRASRDYIRSFRYHRKKYTQNK